VASVLSSVEELIALYPKFLSWILGATSKRRKEKKKGKDERKRKGRKLRRDG